MKSLPIKLGSILIGIIIFDSAELWGANWKLYNYDTDKYDSHYYDTESITHPSKNIVRVWVKTIYSKRGTEEDSILVLQEIDCGLRKIRSLSKKFYFKEEEKLGSMAEESSESKWSFIIPDSLPEYLYKAVCK